MIKPDWNIFKIKFNTDAQKNFEWFCYMLFCQEQDKPQGIFRYKNQRGIETNPINHVGFQAKFYETKLSDHKSDLLSSITNSKKYYPNIIKIIFYTNQEWSQGKNGGDCKAKTAVEKEAKKSDLTIVWRTASFFESPFVSSDNKEIAKHFFSQNNSIFDSLEEKKKHSDTILNVIQTHIIFNEKKIEIDRSSILLNLKKEIEKKQVLILSGAAGAGKTAIIKNFYEEQKDNFPFYVFDASEFMKNDIHYSSRDFSFQDFVKAHAEEIKKIIVIDSAEKLSDKIESFIKNLLLNLISDKWRIIFTTRDSYTEYLRQSIETQNEEIIPAFLNIQDITPEDLSYLSGEHNFSLRIITHREHRLLSNVNTDYYSK
jgi:hypothetical protein